jgi:FHA domain
VRGEEEVIVEDNERPGEGIRRDADPLPRMSSDTTQTFGQESDLSFIPFGSDLSEVELEAIAALPSRAAMLLVRSGPTAGARYLLDNDVTTVGRHPEADIFFDDVTVSRRHSEITRTGSSFELVDQRSLNGTYVNGERVDRAVLVDGSEVRIGKFRLNFFASPYDRGQVNAG